MTIDFHKRKLSVGEQASAGTISKHRTNWSFIQYDIKINLVLLLVIPVFQS